MASVCGNCGFLNEQLDIDAHPLIPGAVSDEAWRQLADLDSSITRLQSLLLQLEHKRATIKREINARVAPILKLPPEISCQIFLTYLANSAHKWDRLMFQRHLTISGIPILFGAVCKAWREYAWSMPQLWTSVQVKLEKNIDPDLVDEWLVRSGTLPLSICVIASLIDGKVSDSDRRAAIAILGIITRHTERWRRVAFNLPQYCYDELKHNKHRLLNLESIFIRGLEELESDLFADAPQLRDVRFRGFRPRYFTLPTTQLTTLSLQGSQAKHCFDILRRSPRVTRCSFAAVCPTGNIHPIFTPHLESLEIGFTQRYTFGANDVARVFNCLTGIPAVHTFLCRSDGYHFPHLSFISLISRSSCTLQELCLDGWQISNNDLIECLRATPSIHTLSLTRLIGTTLRILDPHISTTAALLPNLKTFQYDGSFDFTDLTTILFSRWELAKSLSIAKLQSAKFSTQDHISPDDPTLAQLQLLVKDGMMITLITADNNWASIRIS